MRRFILRLDDACERRDIKKWDRMEEMLDVYNIKPIVGIIPNCLDMDMASYPVDEDFWHRASSWQSKGWHVAMHGYDHVYISESGGINHVNYKSEFAGISLEIQKEKIRRGIAIMYEHGLHPKVFFAPAHTFDGNTLDAIKEESDIRIISDTVANDTYMDKRGFVYIPQQSGRVRNLPFKTVTFCYHPNMMCEEDFAELGCFLRKHSEHFEVELPIVGDVRRMGLYDKFLRWLYFLRR